jgi:hypothetical protein
MHGLAAMPPTDGRTKINTKINTSLFLKFLMILRKKFDFFIRVPPIDFFKINLKFDV